MISNGSRHHSCNNWGSVFLESAEWKCISPFWSSILDYDILSCCYRVDLRRVNKAKWDLEFLSQLWTIWVLRIYDTFGTLNGEYDKNDNLYYWKKIYCNGTTKLIHMFECDVGIKLKIYIYYKYLTYINIFPKI